MKPRPCIIGLDEPEFRELQEHSDDSLICHETLPRIAVQDGVLTVESPVSGRSLPVSQVVFHGIFDDDHDTISGLALWRGPCLPQARAMMDCRLKLPCLVRALAMTQYGAQRGFASAGMYGHTDSQRVAKWGNWHCGENKSRLSGTFTLEHPSIIEPYFEGEAVRVVIIGDQHWQISLAGDDWLKSIHHDNASIMPVDERLLLDTRRIAEGFGLEIVANDYIVQTNGEPQLLEVNHIPNVTRFPEIWIAYRDFVLQWLRRNADTQ